MKGIPGTISKLFGQMLPEIGYTYLCLQLYNIYNYYRKNMLVRKTTYRSLGVMFSISIVICRLIFLYTASSY